MRLARFIVGRIVVLVVCTVMAVNLMAEEGAAVYKTPDYGKFTEAQAIGFNKTAKSRATIYTRLAEYLARAFELGERNGVGIDLGGGPGDLAVELAKRGDRFYWINTDVNSWNSGLTLTLAQEHNVAGKVGFVFADACNLPFRDNYADLMVSRGSYQFWGSLADGIKEVHRVLKPGGWAFIGRGFPPNAPEAEVRELRAGGLAKAPKYVPDEDAILLREIATALGAAKVEVYGIT